MTNHSLKLILCDLGNVLINFDHKVAVKKIITFTDKSFDEVYQFFFDSPLTGEYETGKISSFDFFTRLSQDLQITRLAYEKFVDIWNDIFFENPGMFEVLSLLKKKYRLHLLSNINALHCAYVLDKFPANLAIFDKLFFSHEIGYRKPHIETYRRCVMDCGYRGEETLYIDDRGDLIQEASRLGLKTLLFKNVSDLGVRLRELGVLS